MSNLIQFLKLIKDKKLL